MSEFQIEVECPHCGNESNEHFEVDENHMLDPFGGGGYALTEVKCFNCDKKFWFEASAIVEINVETIYAKKPRKPK